MELYYLNEILDFCTDFINEIDDFDRVELATDFSCIPNTNEISIAIIATQTAVNNFMDNLYTRTKVRNVSEFTWSLLHEVGHCETYRYLNKRTINHCKNIKRKIIRGSIPSTVYYTLADEKMATDWAINFVEQHPMTVQMFDEYITELLNKFYRENNVEMD